MLPSELIIPGHTLHVVLRTGSAHAYTYACLRLLALYVNFPNYIDNHLLITTRRTVKQGIVIQQNTCLDKTESPKFISSIAS